MRTEVKILQHNRVDDNSFFFSKTLKAKKNCTNIFDGPIKILGTEDFRDGRQLEALGFFYA